MAKLHDLPNAVALTGTELIPLDQNDATKKAPAQAFADLALGQAAAVLPVQMAPESGLRWAFIDQATKKLLFALTMDHKLLAPAGAITPDLLDPSIGILPSGVFGAPLAPESAWLTKQEVAALDPADLMQMGGEVMDFLLPSAVKQA
ncbi:hypothetical protein [Sphingomonas oryzagri]|uniref:Uncharacterized protein n=1 Tax=Sphingomonas oryzagri TaxID=3042314 RepID=A0ABT6N7V4_9SPHN|nr:hypothetical protein [Sphingomonas oryzagri]MDH7641160.1 hypothetical protein [Sphingomonas oryzagri]